MNQTSVITFVTAVALCISLAGLASCATITWNSNKVFTNQVFTVKKYDSLVIEPGVYVRLDNQSYIDVFGSITIRGNSGSRVQFKSAGRSVVLETGSSGSFQYTTFEQASNNSYCIEMTDAGTVQFDNIIISGSQGGAGIVANQGTQVIVKNSNISGMLLAVGVYRGGVSIKSSTLSVVSGANAVALLTNNLSEIDSNVMSGGIISEDNTVVRVTGNTMKNCHDCIYSINDHSSLLVSGNSIVGDRTGVRVAAQDQLSIEVSKNSISIPDSKTTYGVHVASSVASLPPISIKGNTINSQVALEGSGKYPIVVSMNTFTGQNPLDIQTTGTVTVENSTFSGFKVALSTEKSTPHSVLVRNNAFSDGSSVVQVQSLGIAGVFSNNTVTRCSSAVVFNEIASTQSSLQVYNNQFSDNNCARTDGLVVIRSLSRESDIFVSGNKFANTITNPQNAVVSISANTKSTSRVIVSINTNTFTNTMGLSAMVDLQPLVPVNRNAQVQFNQNIFMNPKTKYDIKVNQFSNTVKPEASYNYWGTTQWSKVASRVINSNSVSLSPFFLTTDVRNFQNGNLGYETGKK